MANIVAPKGFALSRNLVGGSFTGQTNTYFIPQSDPNAYYLGDVVISAVGADTLNGFPTVQPATGGSGEFVRGVIVGVLPTPALGQTPSLSGNQPLGLEQINVPADKNRGYYVLVADDPNQLFEVMDDGGGSAVVATIAGYASKNCTFTPAAPVNPNLGISATVLNFTVAPTTTLALPVKIMGLAQINAPGGGNQLAPFAVWIVKFNNHELGQASAGI